MANPMTVSKTLSSIGSLRQAVSISLTLKECGATFILYQKNKKNVYLPCSY
ncbi:hypothetical protein I79_001185 [Cricetulus griseus]|uniref:Uncharacterized protein n=1 Tax=Cricetulus griseus TaxID=10029 RepID=G3GU36_CRIGR|nr:hypothetical protein I79_001185 [Cricetulus griseus]